MKHFSRDVLAKNLADQDWLDKVVAAIHRHWRNKNARKRARQAKAPAEGYERASPLRSSDRRRGELEARSFRAAARPAQCHASQNTGLIRAIIRRVTFWMMICGGGGVCG